jgi:hypothetical protein
VSRRTASITGGYVYRGPIDSLRGLYVFADFVVPNVWTVPVSRLVGGSTLPSTEFTVRNSDFAPLSGAFSNIASFGVDEFGNLYVLDLDGEIFIIESTVPGPWDY